ncbi:hypothetical protein L1987_66312 [Smallanthus sonchifolius]|uniref:Uncharacterized protein n=1 Tax=Smallanthus sonchifolius TaxID=185202 RepID=A0ACB9BWS9_9ASTR|nr:hypothetical protein L1987_66312 [Smallanthus sonchifolius]
MDIFDMHDVKAEKENAMLQYQRFRNIAKLFRLVELFLAVVLLSWISTRLPFVIWIFGEYFRQLLSVIVSPLFIFLVGNVIVLTLVVKSGQLTGNFSVVDIAGSDFYEDIVNNVNEDVPPVLEPEEIVYQDKQIISEVNTKPISGYCCKENEIKVSQATPKPSADSVPDLDLKTYRRSQSENLMKRERVVELRRSETEIGRRNDDTPVKEKAACNVVDELSNEEFQRRIEGFIARQVRFHQEEKLSIVPHNFM